MSHALPPRPSLDHLKKQARRRLRVLRCRVPGAQLADAQREVAKSYGYASWTALKTSVDLHNSACDPVAPQSPSTTGQASASARLTTTRVVGIDVRLAVGEVPVAVALVVPVTRYAAILVDGADEAVVRTLSPASWRAMSRWLARCDSVTPPTPLPLGPTVTDGLLGRRGEGVRAYRFVSFDVPTRLARETLPSTVSQVLSRLRRDWRPDLVSR